MTSQINALDTSTYQNIQTAFSAQTSANQIQDIIDLKLDKRRKVRHIRHFCAVSAASVYNMVPAGQTCNPAGLCLS